jgi:phosphatidylserine decarboxylase
MKFHREGYPSLILALLSACLLSWAGYALDNNQTGLCFALGLLIGLFLLVVILQFFRNPVRKFYFNDLEIISPADGKIVVIEKVKEDEFLKTDCIQISVFMSPINVHINRYPLSGRVEYFKYHPGKFLVAWHPKSSTDNERTTTVIYSEKLQCRILFRQIAGALARRIVWYCKEGMEIEQNQEMGFIKFGSRVDVFVPLNAEILVKPGEVVKGGISALAKIL